MEDLSFWGEKATESEPLMFRVPHDAILYVNQITLNGPCANTTSLWITSTASMGILSDDEDDEKESIESDSEDSENPLKSETLAVGHLTWGRQESARTKLVFGGGEKIKFTVEGDGEVHIVGHLVIEDLSFFDNEEDSEDSDYEDEDGHAVVVAGVDSDEGETLYEVIGEEEDSEEDSEDDEDDSDFDEEDVVVEDGPLIEEIDSDEDSEDEDSSDDDEEVHRLDAREVRRLLLGEDAGDRPEDDSDDDEAEFDEAAFYAALARDDGDYDGEDADEMDILHEERARSSNNKKRARSGHFDEEFASPNGQKKHKAHHHSNANSKHHGKHHKQHRRN